MVLVSSSRKAVSPRCEKSCAMVLPARASMTASVSRKRQPSFCASNAPVVDLPAPMNPVSTMRRTVGGRLASVLMRCTHYKDRSADSIFGQLCRGAGGRRGTAVLAHVALDGRPYIVPDGGAGVMNRQKQFRLLGNVFKVAYQRRAVFALLQMLFFVQVGASLEQLRQS